MSQESEENKDTKAKQETPQPASKSNTQVQAEILKSIKDADLLVCACLREHDFTIGELLKLTPGALLNFHSPLHGPCSLLVNHKPFATGRVIQKRKNFAIVVDELLT